MTPVNMARDFTITADDYHIVIITHFGTVESRI